jgi:hypothetical protein
MIDRIALFSLISAAALSADFTTYVGDSLAYRVTAIATDLTGNTYATGSRSITVNSANASVTQTDVFEFDICHCSPFKLACQLRTLHRWQASNLSSPDSCEPMSAFG